MIPTLNDILTLYTGLKDTVYAQMHRNMEDCHTMYNLDFEDRIDVPKGFKVYVPPTAYWIVQTGSNQLITDSPTVDVESVSDTEKAQKSADIEREFAEFLLKQMEIQNEVSPLKECAINICGSGMCVLKGPIFDIKAWRVLERKQGESESDYKERVKSDNIEKRSNFPFYYRAIDPRRFYPDPSGKRQFAFESYKRMALDVKSSWPQWDGYSNDTPFKELDWIEGWHKDWRTYLADTKAIFSKDVIPNLYGFIPYAWGYSGWGKTSPDGKPEERAVGLLNPIISALEEEARFKSAMGNHFRQNVYQPYAKDPTIDGDFTMGPGEIIETPVKNGLVDGIAPFPVARINPDTFPILGSVLQDIQNTSASALLSGQGPNGDTSGYLQGILMGQGRIKFRPALNTLELMASTVIRNTLYLIKHVIKQPVPFAGGKIIRPDDIMEPIIINVSLEPTDPAENDRKLKSGMDLHSRKIISTRTMREDYAGVSDVEESEQILIETIKAMPQYQALLLGEAMENYEMKALVEKLKQLQNSGGIAGQAAPYIEGQGEIPAGMDIKKIQRLGPPGSVNALGSLPENNIVNTGIPGAAGELPQQGGIQ